MKRIKTTIAVILLAALLTGCKEKANDYRNTSGNDDVSDSTSSSAQSIGDKPQEKSEAESSATESSSTSSTQIFVKIPEFSISDPVTESTPESASVPESSDVTENTLSQQEIEQIVKLLADYGSFHWRTFPYEHMRDRPGYPIYPFADKLSKSVYANVPMSSDKDYIKSFGQVVNGDIRTEEQFIAKLDSMFTEKMKAEYFEENKEHGWFVFYEGDLYIAYSNGAGGMGLGVSRLYLDSIEYINDKTILVTVTSVGDKDEWGGDEDIRHTVTAKVVKTDEGFRIDECDNRARTIFYEYGEIIYGDTTINLMD